MVECECLTKDTAVLKARCFNRYMVECELEKQSRLIADLIVLIDTWWNVNLFFCNFIGFSA